jgi:hypothetical protein
MGRKAFLGIALASADWLRMVRKMKLKLQQGQVWKKDDKFLRVVGVDRTEVKYKSMDSLAEREGEHVHVRKKEFCRLIKGATLMSVEEVKIQRTSDVIGAPAPTPAQATPPAADKPQAELKENAE